MRVVLVGHKSMPAGTGGIDRHVEELAATLATMGHEVVSIGIRSRDPGAEPYWEDTYRGVHLLSVSSIPIKGVEATLGTLLAVLKATRVCGKEGVIHLHGGAAALWTWIPRLFGRRVYVTVHALYWREKKWGRFGRKLLRFSEGVAAHRASRVIAVSQPVADWLALRWEIEPVVIPSGVRASTAMGVLQAKYADILAGPYVLFCGRLIRDRRVEDLIAAAAIVPDCPPLVVAGPAEPSDAAYLDELTSLAIPSTRFLGEVPFAEVTGLMSHATVMVNPSLVEGLSIAVLEALAMRCPLILSDIPENRAAAGDCAYYFKPKDPESLAACLQRALSGGSTTKRMVSRGVQRAKDLYDWSLVAEGVAGTYEGREML